jgi:hypothetical protein
VSTESSRWVRRLAVEKVNNVGEEYAKSAASVVGRQVPGLDTLVCLARLDAEQLCGLFEGAGKALRDWDGHAQLQKRSRLLELCALERADATGFYEYAKICPAFLGVAIGGWIGVVIGCAWSLAPYYSGAVV